jgi:hypothetical protein
MLLFGLMKPADVRIKLIHLFGRTIILDRNISSVFLDGYEICTVFILIHSVSKVKAIFPLFPLSLGIFDVLVAVAQLYFFLAVLQIFLSTNS